MTGFLIVVLALSYAGYKLRKAGPSILRFATENAALSRGGAAMLKRVFSR